MPGRFALLREHRGLRQLLRARLASQTADGVFQACLVSYVVFSPEKHATAGAIASAIAVVLLPYSLVGPFAGILIDRLSRQRLLVVCGLLRVAVLLALAGLIAAHDSGPAFYAVALTGFGLNRFVLSTLSAALPRVVPDDLLVSANSLTTTAGAALTLVGAGLGTGLRGLGGSSDRATAAVAVLAAGLYLGAALTAARIPRRALGPVAAAAAAVSRSWRAAAADAVIVARDLRAGAVHLEQRTAARNALVALTAHRVFYGVSFTATVLLYRNYFRTGLAGLALVGALGGLGTVLAAPAVPPLARRFGAARVIVGAFALAAVTEVAFGLPYTQASLAVAALLIGFAAQAAKICVDSTIQRTVDDTFRGRVFAVYDLAFNLSYVLATQLARALPNTGKSYLVLGGIAAGYAVTAVVYGRRPGRPVRLDAGPVATDAPAPPDGLRPHEADPAAGPAAGRQPA